MPIYAPVVRNPSKKPPLGDETGVRHAKSNGVLIPGEFNQLAAVKSGRRGGGQHHKMNADV